MLHYVTDATNGQKVAINDNFVIAVFKATDGPHVGKTVINLNSGQIVVEEEDYQVVAMINNGENK